MTGSQELMVGRGAGARLIAESGALNSPLVLIDVGSRGGTHPRFAPLAPILQVCAFDPTSGPERTFEAPYRYRFFDSALGDQDATLAMHVNGWESRIAPDGEAQTSVARLDTLFLAGSVPPADFIKIDCEGYEPEVPRGAKAYLAASHVLAVDIETTFNTSEALPDSHLSEIMRLLLPYGLRVADFACARPTYPSELRWPGTCNALFRRDIPSTADTDTILKAIAICDIYGLVSAALALVETLSNRLLPFSPRALCGALTPPVPNMPAMPPSSCSALCGALTPPVPRLMERLKPRIPHLGIGLMTALTGRARKGD